MMRLNRIVLLTLHGDQTLCRFSWITDVVSNTRYMKGDVSVPCLDRFDYVSGVLFFLVNPFIGYALQKDSPVLLFCQNVLKRVSKPLITNPAVLGLYSSK